MRAMTIFRCDGCGLGQFVCEIERRTQLTFAFVHGLNRQILQTSECGTPYSGKHNPVLSCLLDCSPIRGRLAHYIILVRLKFLYS